MRSVGVGILYRVTDIKRMTHTLTQRQIYTLLPWLWVPGTLTPVAYRCAVRRTSGADRRIVCERMTHVYNCTAASGRFMHTDIGTHAQQTVNVKPNPLWIHWKGSNGMGRINQEGIEQEGTDQTGKVPSDRPGKYPYWTDYRILALNSTKTLIDQWTYEHSPDRLQQVQPGNT